MLQENPQDGHRPFEVPVKIPLCHHCAGTNARGKAFCAGSLPRISDVVWYLQHQKTIAWLNASALSFPGLANRIVRRTCGYRAIRPHGWSIMDHFSERMFPSVASDHHDILAWVWWFSWHLLEKSADLNTISDKIASRSWIPNHEHRVRGGFDSHAYHFQCCFD